MKTDSYSRRVNISHDTQVNMKHSIMILKTNNLSVTSNVPILRLPIQQTPFQAYKQPPVHFVQ